MTSDQIAAALPGVLASRSRQAFEALLAADVHWHDGSDCADAQHCHSRAEAGQFFTALLAEGPTMTITGIAVQDPDLHVRLRLTWAGTGQEPVEQTMRLRVQDGLICEITDLAPPPVLELLYFDDCPNHEAFLPHLRQLLAEHNIAAPITLTRIETDNDARRHRFLGSPTLRVNGVDVDPTTAGRTSYGMQCRLYTTPDGTTGTTTGTTTGASGTPRDEWILAALTADPDAVATAAAVDAVRHGDVAALTQILAAHPDLAGTRLAQHGGRTLLHIATDWPGHLPNVADTITALAHAGADVNAPAVGPHPETPLHWAASSDDVNAVDALLDAGADINAPGAVIAGGTPLTDATAFGQWAAARRLVERGARTSLWDAAALGLLDHVRDHLANAPTTPEDITSSLWGACHGGHLNTAAHLLDHGGDINWIGYDGLTPLDAARRSSADDVVAWLESHGARTAHPDQ